MEPQKYYPHRRDRGLLRLASTLTWIAKRKSALARYLWQIKIGIAVKELGMSTPNSLAL